VKKKLIEVALPLDAINDASAYDKMPGIGPHPKGLHQWWARLPLPSARAMLFASLVDDPSSDPKFQELPVAEQDRERERLFGIIRSLMQKKIHGQPEVFEAAHAEIVRSCGGRVPTVLDPFSGGGSIPLEAQRLGLKAHASDLNPIAVLITKALIEIPPKFAGKPAVNPESRHSLSTRGWRGAAGLAEDVRFYGDWMRDEAEKQIGHLYPKVKPPKSHGGSEATVIAWIWSRTVKCPNPACGITMPLVRSFSLSTKTGKQAWVEPVLEVGAKSVRFAVKTGKGKPSEGTVNRRGARCVACDASVPFAHVRSEGKEGRMRARLMAIVAEGPRGRMYIAPTEIQESAMAIAKPEGVPETGLPEQALGFRVQQYGMTSHRDLFTSRQLIALTTFSDLVVKVQEKVYVESVAAGFPDDRNRLNDGGSGATAYADAVATYLAFAVDRCSDFNNSLCRWSPSNEKVMNLFGRQAVPMVWDYAEANILSQSVGAWKTCKNYVAECLEVILAWGKDAGSVVQRDAVTAISPGSQLLFSTDPPYYDNIGYADLSDFFYVWLRRTIGKVYPDIFSTLLVPKAQELVATPYRFDGDKEKAKNHFEGGFKKAFHAFREAADPRFPLTVYYAFKQDEDDEEEDVNRDRVSLTTGWETLLEALISTGFQITATWPVRASQKWRMVSMGTNALASYIVLACRARKDDAPIATRREFIGGLKRELPEALRNLQHGNVAPVDLAQASIGPGMAAFSRYSKVLEADGSPMPVRTALQIINQELDAFLTEQEGELDPDTRFCITWFEQRGIAEGPFGEADVLARAKNTSVQGLVDSGVLSSRGGKVKLLSRDEIPGEWDPLTDRRLTIWECTQHLIRVLNARGEEAAGRLAAKLGGGRSEEARALAYRLYSICERKKWAEEAFAYNSLVVSWPSIQEKAVAPEGLGEQTSLF
jgi:putative DNA methylase